MKSYLLHGKQDLRLEERPIPEVLPHQVLIRVRRVGICGSDVHYFWHGYIGSFVPKRPFALGHEFSGEVVEVGREVQTLRPGQAVAVDPSMPCGTCSYCRGGRYNLCENMKFLGSASCDPHLDGAFGEYVPVPAVNCLPIPEALSYGEAAMLEPLSVAVHAVRRAGTVAGQAVLITGAGTIGQLVLIVARAFGADKIVVSDIDAFSREFALQRGADAVLDPREATMEKEAMDASAIGFDVVFEATGVPSALSNALRLARRGGTVVQIGSLPADVPIPANLIMAKELTVAGSFRSAHEFSMALNLAAAKRIDLRPLITATFPYAELPQAMDLAVLKQNTIKVQLEL
jgi:L-idonate 5-dehydrogenase